MQFDEKDLPPGVRRTKDGGWSYTPTQDPTYGHHDDDRKPVGVKPLDIELAVKMAIKATDGDPDQLQRFATEVLKAQPGSPLATALEKARQDQLTRRR